MGDYCKLIVSCTVRKKIEEELKVKIKELGLDDSAYQSQERIESIKQNTWHDDNLDLILIGQTKWGDRQKEFCEWLKPHVVQGSGRNEVYAMSFSEYSDEPTLWKLTEGEYK